MFLYRNLVFERNFPQISRHDYLNSKKSVLMYALLIILLNIIISF